MIDAEHRLPVPVIKLHQAPRPVAGEKATSVSVKRVMNASTCNALRAR
jgi:hypothetical protein